jgi:hypothetical protein
VHPKKTAKKASKKASRSMSDEHKQALAEGRRQGKAVRDYLAALETEAHKPRGRKPTQDPAAIQAQIDAEADPAKRLDLIQKRLDLEERLAADNGSVDLDALEQDFVAAVKPYADRKGISYTALREAACQQPCSSKPVSLAPAGRAPELKAHHHVTPAAPDPRGQPTSAVEATCVSASWRPVADPDRGYPALAPARREASRCAQCSGVTGAGQPAAVPT